MNFARDNSSRQPAQRPGAADRDAAGWDTAGSDAGDPEEAALSRRLERATKAPGLEEAIPAEDAEEVAALREGWLHLVECLEAANRSGSSDAAIELARAALGEAQPRVAPYSPGRQRIFWRAAAALTVAAAVLVLAFVSGRAVLSGRYRPGNRQANLPTSGAGGGVRTQDPGASGRHKPAPEPGGLAAASETAVPDWSDDLDVEIDAAAARLLTIEEAWFHRDPQARSLVWRLEALDEELAESSL